MRMAIGWGGVWVNSATAAEATGRSVKRGGAFGHEGEEVGP